MPKRKKKNTIRIKSAVQLRTKELTNGNLSFYLDIYHNGKRRYEFLKLYAKKHPRTQQEKNLKDNNLELAEKVRLAKESELKNSEFGLISPLKKKLNFLSYCESYIENYDKADNRMIKNSIEQFKKMIKTDIILPNEIDESLIIKYKEFLEKNFNGETPASYLKRFKKVIKQATRDGIFIKNPAIDVNCTISDGIKKAILSVDEIQRLSASHCGNKNVKAAFLFGLNTGLRFCDLTNLTWSEIEIENKRLHKIQKKVKNKSKTSILSLGLNENAMNILKNIEQDGELVFNLPTFSGSLRTVKNWAKRADINKNITWHTARHSFGTNLAIFKNGVSTICQLMGHSGLKYAQIYVHEVDELKNIAVNSLPTYQ